ncbi:MAG: hypothetical protein FJY85_00510 [Deltaproteobacteria bacterium]|nr:hypothetical protein [Deltaproteobacteria bacterium]
MNRNEIGWNERFRRCLYFFLRDELDCILINESLIESYRDFQHRGKEYPFVEMRLLKPRAKIIGPEYHDHRHFIVIFNEGTLPSEAKQHVRFLDSNKVTKENLASLAIFDLHDVFYQRTRYFEDSEFPHLLKGVLKSDFAVLLQRDPTVKARYRYGISHFHVRIDWPVAQAAEDLGKHLRYISKDLFERGDRVAESIQQKLYEYFGFHHTVGGRRTAALVAARYMARFQLISTVYVSSCEARALVRLSEKGIAKYVLTRLTNVEMEEYAQWAGMSVSEFADAYLIDRKPDYGVGIFVVTYSRNEHSTPPYDGKLRELNPDYQWLNVDLQLLVPPPSSGDVRPVPVSRVYA